MKQEANSDLFFLPLNDQPTSEVDSQNLSTQFFFKF